MKKLSNLKSFNCKVYGQREVYVLVNFHCLRLFFANAKSYYKVIARGCISTDINFSKVSSLQVVASIYRTPSGQGVT